MKSKAYCKGCDAHCDYHITTSDEMVSVRGKDVLASQQHAYCSVCGREVFPDEVVGYCVSHAHDAYRAAIGSIPVAQIRELLAKYDIGAQPLSCLLGWGENTIERQMKHTIPDYEHAQRLKQLLDDPSAMQKLLNEHRDAISIVAARKVQAKLDQLLSGSATTQAVMLPVDLMQQVSAFAGVAGLSSDEYVAFAVRSKLAADEEKRSEAAVEGIQSTTRLVKTIQPGLKYNEIHNLLGISDLLSNFAGRITKTNGNREKKAKGVYAYG